MKKYAGTTTKAIAILTSLGLLTACGASQATGTANTADYDLDTAVSAEIQDLGTEEYLITEIDTAATDEEKQAKFISYLEEALAKDIAKAYPSVKDVDITLAVKDFNAALTGTEETTQVTICLDLEEELSEDSIVKIAEAAAKAVDSETDNVTIQDTDGRILYIKSAPFPEDDA